MTKDADNLAIIVALGGVAGCAFFFTPPYGNASLINLIVGGLLGYLAKAAQSPQSQQGNPP